MRDYLGTAPDDTANGILQDMHWSVGLFGYFATYTIGNLISVQLWETFRTGASQCEEQIRAGEISELRRWLHERIHRHGRSYQPRELLQRVTGAGLEAAP